MNLFNAIKDRTKSIVYVSGLAVFFPEDGAVDESSPKNPDTEFVRIRTEAEEFLHSSCRDRGIDFTVVYLPDVVYGNRGYFRSMFLEGIRDGKFRVPGSGDYVKNFIHLDDAADILITIAAKNAVNESFIATDSHPAPFREFVDFIAGELGAKRPGSAPVFLAKAAVGAELIKMLKRPARASNEKIRKIYEFRYSSYREGIPEVVSEFKLKKASMMSNVE